MIKEWSLPSWPHARLLRPRARKRWRAASPRAARISWFTAGTGYAFDETYVVVGLGANYYVVDGLNVGLHWEYWTGSDPKMSKLTPSVRYVFIA